MNAARSAVTVDVPPERLYALITDFDTYPTFVPNQSAVRVLSHEGDRWRVEFELSIVKTLRYTLDLVGEPGRSLSWTLVSGDMMRAMTGGWTLEALPDGRTRATYALDVELKGFVPRSVSRSLVERTLPANLEAFKNEAERRG
ncbi:MAG: SRPBCC family protein [Myxococcales bacterium]|nr:SRPBCC family protein [Myxococcales bacterium]